MDKKLKKLAAEILAELGMEMSSVMNIFLRQCVMRGELFYIIAFLKRWRILIRDVLISICWIIQEKP